MDNPDLVGAGGAPSTPPPSRGVKEEVKTLLAETKEGTARVADKARNQAHDLAGRQKEQVARTVSALSGALRESSRNLQDQDEAMIGRYAATAADQVERLASYLQNTDTRRTVRDLETLARRHPDLFLGGAFLTGLVVARFLKSSAPEAEPTAPAPGPSSPEALPFNPVLSAPPVPQPEGGR